MSEFWLSNEILPLLPPDEKISVIDLGARGGCSQDWLAINNYVNVYGFDPDLNECARLNELALKNGLNQQFFPYCIASSNGRRKFYLTNEGGSSSLYKPNERFINRTCTKVVHDNEPIHNYAGLNRIIELETITLEEWRHRHKVTANIDFIKLDIQGAEYEVLNSSRSFLKEALGVIAEVWFYPLYENLPLFGDVDALMRQYKFEFFSFHLNLPGQFFGRQSSPVHFDSIETYLDQKRAGQIVTADALYYIDYLATDIRYINPVEAIKLAVLAEIGGQIEYAFEVCQHLAVTLSINQPEAATRIQSGCIQAANNYKMHGPKI